MPIDSQYPLKRIEHMLDISEAKYIITTKQYSNLPEFGVDLIFIEDFVASYDNVLECRGNGDDLFSIFFTSGTTGLPKGVMFSNKQIASETAVLQNFYHSHPGMFVDVMSVLALHYLQECISPCIMGKLVEVLSTNCQNLKNLKYT